MALLIKQFRKKNQINTPSLRADQPKIQNYFIFKWN